MLMFIDCRSLRSIAVVVTAALAAIAAPVVAQVQSVDPDAAIDGDLTYGENTVPSPSIDTVIPDQMENSTSGNGTPVGSWNSNDLGTATAPAADETSTTYHKDDLMGAAEGVFGKGSEGLAEMIEDLLRKQGEPNAYIVGREAGGAVAFGLRYGSGTMYHKVEGQRPVYWTGPSLGFDLGLNGGKAFVLVYNLYDSQELFHRYGAGEGQAYLVGGFNVSYLRRGDVVLIPVRMGAGLRLGANVGYMKFSENQRWLPF